MNRMNRLVLAAWFPFGLGVAVANAVPDAQSAEPTAEEASRSAIALEILKKADQATRAVKTVRYDVTWEGTEWLADRTWTLQGHVVSKKAADGVPPLFHYTVTKAIAPGSDRELQYTAGSNGTEFFLIDSQTKKVHRGSEPAVLGRGGRVAQSLAMREFTHATPFTDEITGDKTLLLGTETVDGEECQHIYVMYKGGQEAEWYFSKEDFLPRRVDRIRRNHEGEKAKQIRIITNLVVDPEVPEETFTVRVPEGYEETTELAPDPRIPM